MILFPSISLIIPCYNEEQRVVQLIEGLKDFIALWHAPFEIIIVNDGSTDNTVKLLEKNTMLQQLLADDKLVLLHQKNKGKGAALKYGVSHATMAYTLTLDADMATHPQELIQWMQEPYNCFSNTNTISIASRPHPNSKLILISTRRDSGALFNTIVQTCTGLNITDTQCGFKLYPTTIAKQLFAALKTPGWSHDVELLLRAKQANYILQELPITWNEKAASKIHVIKDGLKMVWDVLWIKWKM